MFLLAIYIALIDGFQKDVKLDDATKLFCEMIDKNKCPNLVNQNALIEGLCEGKVGGAYEALSWGAQQKHMP